MQNGRDFNFLRPQVKPVLKSKIEEFYLLGYKTINEDELWEFLTKKKWRKRKEDIKLFEIVQEIMEVTVSDYINFATIELLKSSEHSVLSEEERKELLK